MSFITENSRDPRVSELAEEEIANFLTRADKGEINGALEKRDESGNRDVYGESGSILGEG